MAEEQRHFTHEQAIGFPSPRIGILDIGAMPTSTPRYQSLMDQGCAQLVEIEPNERSLRSLSDDEKDRFVGAYLGDGDPAVFRDTLFPGCSSLLVPDPDVINTFHTILCGPLNGNFTVLRERPVETMRLDDLPDLPPVDYLSIDTQGSELSILENGTRVLADTLVLESEVEFLRLYKNQPLLGHLQTALDQLGFVLHKLIDIVGRPARGWDATPPLMPVSQMLWADAVFIRDFNNLERFSDTDLLKSATILNDVYLSYDIAHLHLREHDRRNGGELARAYLAKFVEARPTHRLYGNFKGKA
jgi:hypothetical protein